MKFLKSPPQDISLKTTTTQKIIKPWNIKLKELLSKELSLTGKPNLTPLISKDELDCFCLLIHKGLDIKTMLKISFKNYEEIIDLLSEGKSLTEIFCLYQKTSFFKLLKILSQKLDLKSSMEAVQEIEQSAEKLKKDLLKRIGYPIFIFLFAFCMIWFFSLEILPQMQIYSDSGSNSGLLYFYLIQFLITILFAAGLGILFLWGIYSIAPFSIKFLEKILLSFPVFRQIYSYQYAVLLKAMLNQNLNTQECFHIFAQLKFLKSISIYQTDIEKQVLKGIPFLEAVKGNQNFDKKLIFMIDSGIQTMTLSHLLEIYCTQSILTLNQAIKNLSYWVQMISYISVGCLVIAVYQIMLMPLNMLYEM